MTAQAFVAAIAKLIEDESMYKRHSKRNLCVFEGILTVVLDRIKAELRNR